MLPFSYLLGKSFATGNKDMATGKANEKQCLVLVCFLLNYNTQSKLLLFCVADN